MFLRALPAPPPPLRSLSLMQEPMSMPCSHTFCRACLSQAIGGRGKCPICKVEATRRTLVPNEQMARFIRYYKELLSTGEDPGGMVRASRPVCVLDVCLFTPAVGSGVVAVCLVWCLL